MVVPLTVPPFPRQEAAGSPSPLPLPLAVPVPVAVTVPELFSEATPHPGPTVCLCFHKNTLRGLPVHVGILVRLLQVASLAVPTCHWRLQWVLLTIFTANGPGAATSWW